MKKIKLYLKRLVVSYLVVFMLLSTLSQSQARMYDAQCGEYLANYARDFIEKYCKNGNTEYAHVGFVAKDGPHWSSGVFGQGTFRADCTNGVHYMYFKALGVDIQDYGYCASDSAIAHLNGSYAQYWEKIPLSEVEAGDVVLRHGHGELYIGNGQNANFGNSPHSGTIGKGPGNFEYAFRPKFDVNPTGTLGGVAEEEDLNIYDKNGFIYTGVPTLSGYKNSPPFGKWIIKMLAEILDYLIGILTFAIRVVVVGWTAIVERVFIDGMVNAVTGVSDERVDTWKSVDSEEVTTEDGETMLIGARQQETYSIKQEGEEGYVSEGVVAVGNVGGKIDLRPSSEQNITVENIVYNKVPILDVNFFNFKSAGGAVVEEDGIIYLLKTNVAMWYYIFRVMAIALMLAVLIYCGIRMALSTVAEKKAVYKRMLVDWLIGFFLVFAVGFIIYFVIYLNEQFIEWVIPKTEDGSEILLYETIRSKAYELKASTGFTGMIMYIIMVYYAIRFLIVYFKRYLTATILALMGPFMAVSYAIEKVNKGGRGASKKYGDWLRDFSYTILMQSMHALIYTVFISTILKLTEVSLVGIVISFMFLGFMLKVDPIFRKIFGLTGGKNVGKLSMAEGIAPQVTAAQIGAKYVKKVGKGYGNFAKAAVKPIGNLAGKAGDKIHEASDRFSQERALKEGKTLEEYRAEKEKADKEKEQRRKARERKLGEAVAGAKIAGGIAKTAALGALVLPMYIVEAPLGTKVLAATMKSSQKTKDIIQDAFKKGYWKTHAYTIDFGRKLKLAGIKPMNPSAQRRLEAQYNRLGYSYRLVGIPDLDTGAGGGSGPSGGPPMPDQGQSGGAFGIPDALYSRLNETQQSRLKLTGKISGLKIADDNLKEISEIAEEQGIDAAAAYAELLAMAEEQEKELERSYKEATDSIDEQIAQLEASGSPEMIELARSLKAKKEKEIAEAYRILKEPFNEKDIERAIKNYKSQVPQFNENTDFITQQDVEGISKQIEKVLKEKGVTIEISKDFIAKVEKELKDKKQKDAAEQASRSQAVTIAGQDQSRTMKDDVVEGTDLTLKERIKALNTDDRGTNPYSTSNPNAPHSGAPRGESANDRLVKGIMSGLRATGKVSTNYSKPVMNHVSNMNKMHEIGERIAKFTGTNPYSEAAFGRVGNL